MSQILASTLETSTIQAVPQTKLNGSQWHAFLHLNLALTARGVVLKHCAHQGPLYIQKPFYPEGKQVAHLYILHPPGGLVSGDQLTLECKQDKQTHTLITTPGASRVYRSREDKSLQSQFNHFTLDESAKLEWLPQETILFPDVKARLRTQIDLAKDAHVIAWEVTCFGLPASQQTFEKGELNQTLEIRQQGRLKLRERILINQEKLSLLSQLAGLNQQTVNGLMVAGPFEQTNRNQQNPALESLIEALQICCEEINQDQDTKTMASVSLTGDFLLIRYLGQSSEQAKQLYLACWQKVRPLLLKREVCIPRIWAT